VMLAAMLGCVDGLKNRHAPELKNICHDALPISVLKIGNVVLVLLISA
jgi:hypothetical protein